MRTTTTLPKSVLGQLGSSVDDIAKATRISMGNQYKNFGSLMTKAKSLSGGALKGVLTIALLDFGRSPSLDGQCLRFLSFCTRRMSGAGMVQCWQTIWVQTLGKAA